MPLGPPASRRAQRACTRRVASPFPSRRNAHKKKAQFLYSPRESMRGKAASADTCVYGFAPWITAAHLRQPSPPPRPPADADGPSNQASSVLLGSPASGVTRTHAEGGLPPLQRPSLLTTAHLLRRMEALGLVRVGGWVGGWVGGPEQAHAAVSLLGLLGGWPCGGWRPWAWCVWVVGGEQARAQVRWSRNRKRNGCAGVEQHHPQCLGLGAWDRQAEMGCSDCHSSCQCGRSRASHLPSSPALLLPCPQAPPGAELSRDE